MGNQQHKRITSTELTQKQMAVLKATTKFTEKEIREWHEGFIRDCPTGRLDKKKFIEIFQAFYPKGQVENYCKHAFRTFDTNNDGRIDFQEFLLAIATTSQGDLDTRLAAVFDMYDISNDGLIDEKELTTLISAMYDLLGEIVCKDDYEPKTIAAAVIEKLDVNGDKKLNKAEFIAGCKNNQIVRQFLAPNI
ncbi:unnamed protein product [Rotaria sordida]|uniref:EF-hand domain-containing protein n=1 Tax=Rotaria sordida TaxID=392033 RepID=A0A814H0U8_9BILA|nr:unnamed protein product [Rotaria sordida]